MFPIEIGVWGDQFENARNKYGKGMLGVGGMDKTAFRKDRKAVDAESSFDGGKIKIKKTLEYAKVVNSKGVYRTVLLSCFFIGKREGIFVGYY
jgi:hypothetical protein